MKPTRQSSTSRSCPQTEPTQIGRGSPPAPTDTEPHRSARFETDRQKARVRTVHPPGGDDRGVLLDQPRLPLRPQRQQPADVHGRAGVDRAPDDPADDRGRVRPFGRRRLRLLPRADVDALQQRRDLARRGLRGGAGSGSVCRAAQRHLRHVAVDPVLSRNAGHAAGRARHGPVHHRRFPAAHVGSRGPLAAQRPRRRLRDR